MTEAIRRAGVHPFNPLYSPGYSAPLRYHYFWFLLCSVVTQLGGALGGKSLVSSQQAIIASVVWCGWSLIALVPLYVRFFQGRTGTALRRFSLAAIGLLAVTGLDIIPNVVWAATGRGIYPDMEWWNEQVTSWIGSLLWVPHDVAALVACLMGFLLVWQASVDGSARGRIAGGVLAGVAFATSAGTSAHVALMYSRCSRWPGLLWRGFRGRAEFVGGDDNSGHDCHCAGRAVHPDGN